MWKRTLFWIFIFGSAGSLFWYVEGRDLSSGDGDSGTRGPRDFPVHPGMDALVQEPGHSTLISPEVEGVLGRIHRARERLEKAPEDVGALIILGNANYDIRRYDRAKDYYLAALKLDPDNVPVRTDLASCYRILGDSARAVQELETVLRIDPAHGTALYNLGVILLNDFGKTEEAVRLWEDFVSRHPHDPMVGGLQERIQELKK